MLMHQPATQMFAQLEDFSRDEVISAKTRAFVGEGNSFLPIDKVIGVLGVRVGNSELPLTEVRHYPYNNQMHTSPVEEPLVQIQTRSVDNQDFLVRSKISNDGIWPKGTKIFVTADWADQPELISIPEPAVLFGEKPFPDINDAANLHQRIETANATGDNRALTNPGTNPVITDPVGAVTGVYTAPEADPLLSLGDETLALIQKIGDAEAVINAPNERFNELGIKGVKITQIKNALRKAIADSEKESVIEEEV